MYLRVHVYKSSILNNYLVKCKLCVCVKLSVQFPSAIKKFSSLKFYINLSQVSRIAGMFSDKRLNLTARKLSILQFKAKSETVT